MKRLPIVSVMVSVIVFLLASHFLHADDWSCLPAVTRSVGLFQEGNGTRTTMCSVPHMCLVSPDGGLYKDDEALELILSGMRSGTCPISGTGCCCSCLDFEGTTTESTDRKAWVFNDSVATRPPFGSPSIVSAASTFAFSNNNYLAIGDRNEVVVCVDCNDNFLFKFECETIDLTCIRQINIDLWLLSSGSFTANVLMWNFDTSSWDVIDTITGPTVVDTVERYEITVRVEDPVPYEQDGVIYVVLDPLCSLTCNQLCLDYMRLCFQACRDGLDGTAGGATGATGAGVTGATGAGVTGATGAGVTGATGAGVTGATGAGVTGPTGVCEYPIIVDVTGCNTALGEAALESLTSGVGNTAMGGDALGANTSGSRNTAIGCQSLTGSPTGSDNTAVGYGSTVDSARGVAVGSLTHATDDAVAIGYNAYVAGSYGIALGTDAVAPGNAMVIGDSSGNVLHVLPGWSATPGYTGATGPGMDLGSPTDPWRFVYAVDYINCSDERRKKNITDSELGLDFISRLHPVSYTWKHDKRLTPKHYGLIAQEVEVVTNELGVEFSGLVYDNKHDVYNLSYQQFISPLIKAMQELDAKYAAEVAQLKAQIEQLQQAQ